MLSGTSLPEQSRPSPSPGPKTAPSLVPLPLQDARMSKWAFYASFPRLSVPWGRARACSWTCHSSAHLGSGSEDAQSWKPSVIVTLPRMAASPRALFPGSALQLH